MASQKTADKRISSAPKAHQICISGRNGQAFCICPACGCCRLTTSVATCVAFCITQMSRLRWIKQNYLTGANSVPVGCPSSLPEISLNASGAMWAFCRSNARAILSFAANLWPDSPNVFQADFSFTSIQQKEAFSTLRAAVNGYLGLCPLARPR